MSLQALDVLAVVVIAAGSIWAALAWRWTRQDADAAKGYMQATVAEAVTAVTAADRAEAAAKRADAIVAAYLRNHPERGAADLRTWLPGGATGLPVPLNAAERALGKRLGGEGA